MTNTCQLSNNTIDYVKRYRCILDTMIENMTSVCLTDSISANFIKQMIPHHRAAIEMSENLLRFTTCIPLQNIAQNIICSQKESICSMEAICPECSRRRNTPRALNYYQRSNECILRNMFREMHTACTDNCIDANFMREMILHHRGAVLMSQNALKFCICPELKPILESIIDSQEKGVQEMQQLLGEITQK